MIRIQTLPEQASLQRPPRPDRTGSAGLWLLMLWMIWSVGALGPAQGQDDSPGADPVSIEDLPATTDPESDEFSDLPKLETLTKPSFEDLMTGPAIDWLILNQERVLKVESVVPRPRTVEQLNEQIRKLAPRAGQQEAEAAKRKRLALYQLPVTLLEGEEREYTLHIKYIKEIRYHEDLMLERIDALLAEGQVRKAYELLAAVEERDSSWPGLAPRREQILFVDAQAKLAKNQPEHALSLVESLHARNPNFAGLPDLFGRIVGRLVEVAVAAGDYRQGRYFIRRGARLFANHPVIAEWSGRLMQQTRDLLQQALQAESSGNRREAFDRAELASRVWPGLQELVTPYSRIANRWQRLRVGVVDFPRSPSPEARLVAGFADDRHQQLTSVPLFQPYRLDDRVVRFQSRFLTDWEPRELGHTVQLRLRPWQSAADSQPLLTAFDVSQMFASRILPGGRNYDARLGSMIERVEIDGPFELSIHLAQVPLRPEVLLALPAATPLPEPSESTESLASPPQAAEFPFVSDSQEANSRRYVRTFSQPDGLPEYHLAEIVERSYPDYDSAIQGLLRGEVSLLPRIPLSTVRQLETRKEFFTQAYGLPTSHLLLLNHQRPVLKLRSFRRALVYAVDRSRILQEVFLKESPGELGRLTSAPWCTRSYAYSPFVAPHQFDASLAFSLAHTAARELDAPLPSLKMYCASDPEVISAAGAIVAAWKRIGVDATLMPLRPDEPDPPAGDWDVIYHTGTLAEPATELAPLLTHSRSTAVEAYGTLPAWLRRDLLELDRAGDWNTNTQIMHRLHRQIWAEVELIPLWELDDRFVCRRQVRNIPERPVRPYQNADRWRLEPWYPRETAP